MNLVEIGVVVVVKEDMSQTQTLMRAPFMGLAARVKRASLPMFIPSFDP
jgi:hypothetical protein